MLLAVWRNSFYATSVWVFWSLSVDSDTNSSSLKCMSLPLWMEGLTDGGTGGDTALPTCQFDKDSSRERLRIGKQKGFVFLHRKIKCYRLLINIISDNYHPPGLMDAFPKRNCPAVRIWRLPAQNITLFLTAIPSKQQVCSGLASGVVQVGHWLRAHSHHKIHLYSTGGRMCRDNENWDHSTWKQLDPSRAVLLT